jgi:hypothetical protein
MALRLRGPWSLPKLGSGPETNDDAARAIDLPSGRRRWFRTVEGMRLAVADGATQSFLAGRWAELLVGAALEGPIDGFGTRVDRLRLGWPDELERYRTERAEAGRPLAWFEEPKLADGAASTVLVVEVRNGVAELGAIGDSIAVLVREGHVIDSFPIDDPSAFGNHPTLVRTVSDAPEPQIHRWELRRGDHIVVVTDAVGAWLLSRAAEGSVASLLDDLTDESRFGELVRREREAGRLQDDDATVAVMAV